MSEKSLKVLAEDLKLKGENLDQEKIPLEFDKMGQTEGFNYIAVVHSDGNNMGLKLKNLFDSIKNNNDEEYIKKLRNFSIFLDEINNEAIADSIEKLLNENEIKEKKIYPLRPIIYGGDDLTLVCSGEYGLLFSEIYASKIKEISQKKEDYKNIFGKNGISVCTGVAITHTSFPFNKAYSIAEELLKEAKIKMKNNPKYQNQEGFAVDWHIETGSILTDINTIRKKNYTNNDKILTAKPYYFCINGEYNSFNSFKKALKILRKIPSSKYKLITRLLRESIEHYKEFKNIYLADYKREYEEICKIMNVNKDNGMVENEQVSPLIDLIETEKFCRGEENK